MTTQLTFWAVNNLYHSPNSSYNEQAQEAFASKSMMRLLVPDALVGHIVDQLDAMVERGSDPDYDFDASDFDGAEVTPDHYLLLTVKQAVMFLRFLERDIHIADATDAQKRNFVSAYERIMKQTLVVMPDDTAPDGNDTPSDTDVATETTTYRNPEIETKYKATLDKIISLFEVNRHGLLVLRSALPNNAPINKLHEAGYIRLALTAHIAPDLGLLAYWQATDPDGFNATHTAIKAVAGTSGILRMTRERMATIAPDVVEVEICHCAKCGDELDCNWSLAVCDACLWADAADDTPADTDPAPVLAEIMSWVAWNVENFGADGTYHSVDLLPNISLDGLGKWLRVRKGFVYFRLAWWRLLAQDNPAVYHQALRNMILAKAELSKVHSSLRNTSYAKKQRRAYRRLDRIYRTVSRYKYGVE